MASKFMLHRFILFSFLMFSPAYLFFMIFLQGLILLFFIEASIQTLVSIIFLALTPVTLSFSCYMLSERSQSPTTRFILAYLTWLIFGSVIAYLFAASIAGVSMAVVDGVVGGWDLLRQELIFSLELLAFAQIFIIPWALATTYIAKRLQKHLF